MRMSNECNKRHYVGVLNARFVNLRDLQNVLRNFVISDLNMTITPTLILTLILTATDFAIAQTHQLRATMTVLTRLTFNNVMRAFS